MELVTSVLSLLPSTKKEANDFSRKLIDELLVGDPIKIMMTLKAMEAVIKAVRSNVEVRNHVVAEVEKYEKGELVYGNEIAVCETGTKWDYQGDYVLVDLSQSIDKIDYKVKERQKMLQSLSSAVYDDEGTEVLPAVKSSTTNFKIILR